MVSYALTHAARTLAALGLLLAAGGCGSSPAPACPSPCNAPNECRAGVCVGFRTPLWDAANPTDGDTLDAGIRD